MKTISIIEDKFPQFLIARELLNEDYRIVPDFSDLDSFNSFKGVMEGFLNRDNNNTDEESFIKLFEETDVFVVDWQLIEGHSNKTGISFCKFIRRAQNGKLVPILFLTSNPSNEAHNPISNACKEPELTGQEKIIKDSEKPLYWKNANKFTGDKLHTEVAKIASQSKETQFYQTYMRDRINEMLANKDDDSIDSGLNDIM